MKIFKILALCFLSITLILCSTTSASAKNIDDNIDTLLKESYIKYSDDYQDLIKVYDSSLDKIKDISNYSKSLDNDKKLDSSNFKSFSSNLNFDENQFFKLYNLDNPNCIKYFKDNGNFKDNISKDFNWMCPVYNDGNLSHLATFTKDNNNLKLIGFTENINPSDFEFFINLDKVRSLLKENNLTNPSEIKFVRLDKYHVNLIYIIENNTEYGIPFAPISYNANLYNGKLYKIPDLLDKLYDYAPEESLSKEKHGGGTNKINYNKTKSFAIFLILSSSSLLLFLNLKKGKML